ncbi:hypothetical protein DFJ77DRAFT_462795 [Powellomyces hirtus]|nr:hypothetical protein DFJ77DRAFT_462795 [Powellomyces hirtus]
MFSRNTLFRRTVSIKLNCGIGVARALLTTTVLPRVAPCHRVSLQTRPQQQSNMSITNTTSSTGISPLEKVAEDIWLSKASKHVLPKISPSIALVIIFGWMGGDVRHLRKYAEFYEEKNVDVLIVGSRGKHFFQPPKAVYEQLAPVASILAEHGVVESRTGPSNSAGVVKQRAAFVHVFSDGGSRMLKYSTDMLRDVHGQRLRTAGIVFDSCPGRFTVATAVRAFTASIHSKIARPIAVGLLFMFFSAARLFHIVTFTPDRHDATRKALLESNRFGVQEQKEHPPPRHYHYSESDQLITFDAVEQHARDASILGADVTTKKWNNTPHVRHMQADPDAYWHDVEKVLNKGTEYVTKS